jgi:hypothetical protein
VVSPIVSSMLSHVISPEHPSYQARTDSTTPIPVLQDLGGVQKQHPKHGEKEIDERRGQRGSSPPADVQSSTQISFWGTAPYAEQEERLDRLFPAPLSSSAYVPDSEVELLKTRSARRTRSVGPGETSNNSQLRNPQRVKGHTRASSGGSEMIREEPLAAPQRRTNHVRQSSAPDSVQRSPTKVN